MEGHPFYLTPLSPHQCYLAERNFHCWPSNDKSLYYSRPSLALQTLPTHLLEEPTYLLEDSVGYWYQIMSRKPHIIGAYTYVKSSSEQIPAKILVQYLVQDLTGDFRKANMIALSSHCFYDCSIKLVECQAHQAHHA